jgi:hypothetical protein
MRKGNYVYPKGVPKIYYSTEPVQYQHYGVHVSFSLKNKGGQCINKVIIVHPW